MLEQQEALKVLDDFHKEQPQTHEWALAFSGGKDSTVLLDIFQKWLRSRHVNYRGHYLFGDTGQLFQQTYDYALAAERHWGVKLTPIFAPEIRVRRRYFEERGVAYCCGMLKRIPLMEASRRLGIGSLLVGFRNDEGDEGESKPPFERLDFPLGYGTLSQWRVRPIAHYTEEDIWHHIEHFSLPYNPLYDEVNEQGARYRSIGCECCTEMVLPEAAERSGRSISIEEGALEWEKKFGYYRS